MEDRRQSYGFRSVEGVEGLMAKVVAAIDRGEDEAGALEPMIDFDERDLLTVAEEAGFVDIRLNLIAEVTTEPMWKTRDWQVFLESSPNPLAPTFGEAMDTALAPREVEKLTTVLRPQIESGLGTTRMARAFMAARKPAA